MMQRQQRAQSQSQSVCRPRHRAYGAVLFGAACLWAAAVPAQAIDLVQAWRAAQQNDLEFAAAQSAHLAGAAQRRQSDSLWRPSVQLTASAGLASSDSAIDGARFSAPGLGQSNGVSFNTSVTNGNMQRWAVSARQPLISGERSAQARQLILNADIADLEWHNANQALMLRVAERYFDVMLATDTLRVLRRQESAVERAQAETRERFQLGDVKVTDTHEAAARAEAVKAQVLAADADLQVKQAALADVTGVPDASVPLRPANRQAPVLAAASLAEWQAKAQAGNPLLQMRIAGVAVAKQEAAKFSVQASPSLDLVLQLGRNRLSGSGDFGNAGNTGNDRMIGVQLTIPLYTGGYRSARQDQALLLADKAETDASRSRQQTALQIRSLWLGLTVGAARVAALAESSRSSQARLAATRLGNEVGDRTTLDLLNAENDAANAELMLLQARIGLLLDRLRLAALAGELDEAQLQAVNATLQE
jgi:outer membrane protein